MMRMRVIVAQRIAFYPRSVGVIKLKDDPGNSDASGKSRRIESKENAVQSYAADELKENGGAMWTAAMPRIEFP